jgi:hypothetical protein
MYKQRIAYLTAGLILFLYLLLVSHVSSAQNDQGYIYGKVITIDDREYKGQIRWGKEETFWDDIFNSTKIDNEYLKYLDRGDYRYLRNRYSDDDDFSWNFWEIWEDKYSSYSHQFAIRFGDMSSIRIVGRDDVEVEFKNGMKMEFEGGSNDIGAKLRIYDEEIGQLRLSWDRIDEVIFMETPKNLKNKYGEPLTGTVKTSIGEFQGLIQWDHQECLTNDMLDGESEDGDLSIPFGNIKSIERDGRGSEVVLRTGRTVYLRGTNDVNSENRGIIVKDPAIGKIKIGWRDFDKVIFDDEAKTSGMAYSDYAQPKELEGALRTKSGETFTGKIVYDLDETWDFELLNGNDEDIEFIIPFRNISGIVPKNYNYSTIELKNGSKLLLGNGQDVSDRNDGIIVFVKGGDPIYVPWMEVAEIQFK